jgi:ribosome-binding factor A
MKRDRPLKELPALCGQLGADDGIDPRETLRQFERKRGGHKTQQLCAQVAEALNYAFAATCNDDVLRELGIVAVQPAPDESRLLVTVGPALSGPCDRTQVLTHLQKARGKLRSEVASAIHRKKVPELAFCVVNDVEGT